MTTFPFLTPGTPPSSNPLPPWNLRSECAPTCGASLPATSDIGASNGKALFSNSTVS